MIGSVGSDGGGRQEHILPKCIGNDLKAQEMRLQHCYTAFLLKLCVVRITAYPGTASSGEKIVSVTDKRIAQRAGEKLSKGDVR